MPKDRDVELLEGFLQEIQSTFALACTWGDLSARERNALDAALKEFAAQHPSLIVEAYRATPDTTLAAAGVLGQQLEAKIEIPKVVADLLWSETEQTGRRRKPRLKTGIIRRWIRRARVLVGTLARILPPAEALSELLDLFDAALDRVSTG